MHKVLETYLNKFVKDNDFDNLKESEQFERFMNFSIVYKYFPDHFDVNDITTSEDDEAIDGVAIIINDQLILTHEEAKKAFEETRPRQTLSVRYIFIQSKTSESFDGGEISKFGNGIYRLFTQDNHEVKDEVLAEVREIHEIVVENLSKVENGRPDILLFFCSTGTWQAGNSLSSQITTIKNQIEQTGLFNHVLFDPVDREAVFKYWNQTQAPVTASFTVQSMIPVPSIEKVGESYVVIASALEFIDKVLSDDDKRMRPYVFEHNVRAFLGDDNPINTRIKESLIDKKQHDRFSILNNGITIVSPDVKVQATKVSITDFQIVNGCQTCHVLFRNKSILSEQVRIQIKIIETEDPDILAQVVEATNSQSNVAQSQFLSIRPFVRKLEKYFDAHNTDEADINLFFERRTKQFTEQNIGKSRVLDIENLARVYSAMFLDVPHLTCRYPTQTFKEMNKDLYKEDHRESSYYAAALAKYRLTLAFRNNYIDNKYKPYIWHILMIIKYIILGKSIPALNSKKSDITSEKIIDIFKSGGKLPLYKQATDIIDKVGLATRDRLKRQSYTQEIKSVLNILSKDKVITSKDTGKQGTIHLD